MIAVGFVALMLIFGGTVMSSLARSDAVLVVAFGFLIFGGAHSTGVIKHLFSWPFLVLLGEASYGIYILQTPVGSVNQVTKKIFQLENAPNFDFFWVFCVFMHGVKFSHFCISKRRFAERFWGIASISRFSIASSTCDRIDPSEQG